MEPVSLDTSPVDTSVSLDTTVAPLNDAAASTRAGKAELGLAGVTGKDKAGVYQDINNGGEDNYRSNAAASVDKKIIDNKLNLLAKGNYKPEQLEDFYTPPTDSTSVIERAYGDSYVRQLEEASRRIDDNIISTAQTEDQGAVDRYFAKGGDILSRREYAISQAQNIQPEVDKDAYFHIPFPEVFGGPIAIGSKTAPIHSALNWATLGIYGGLRQEWLSRGNTPETSRLAGVLAGNNVRAQAQEILSQPTFEASKELFDKGFERIRQEDPALAQQWAMSIAGMSTNEMITQDAMSSANIIGAAGLFQTAKGLLRGAGDAKLQRIPVNKGDLNRGADGVYRTGEPTEPSSGGGVARIGGPAEASENVQEAYNAVKDVLRNSPADPTKTTIAEAVGDTAEAAVQKTITSIKQQDPARDAIDTLFDMHRVNQEQIRRNPGNNSREEHTRLLDAGESFEKNTVDTLVNTTDLVRLPALAETGFRDVADRVKDYFKGQENTIVNIEMYHDPVSNTEHHVITFGNYDGRPFTSKRQATNAATIRGLGKPQFTGNDATTVYIPRTAVLSPDFSKKETVTWKPNPNFITKKEGDHWSFVLGHPDGSEVFLEPSFTPEPTHIPFDTKTGKFGQPLAVGPHIIRNGVGYHIKYYVPLNEQDDIIRDNHLITGPRTTSSSSTKSLVNGSYLGYLRLPQDTLAPAEVDNRAKLVYTQNRHFNLIKQEMEHVQKLYTGLTVSGKFTGANSRVWNEFKRSLVASQKLPDPDTGLPGYYMRTPLEIQHFWSTAFDRPVTFAEQQAYLAVGRMDYADWVFRNVGVYKNKSRLGVMEHRFTTSNDPDSKFEGRLISKLPEGDIPAMIHERDGSVKWYNGMNTKDKKEYREAFARGEYRGVQLWNPDTYPIKVFDSQKNPVRVVYIVSNALESSPMTYKQVGYRGGGHWDYNYDRYIKQPIMRKFIQGGKTHWIYEGDATFAPIKNHADGELFIKNLNQIVRLLKDKKVAEAKALHLSYSDQPWKDFVKGFFPTKVDGELQPARFNLHEDFRVLPKGFTTPEWDKGFVNKYKALPKSKFVNAANGEQNLARNYQVEYTGARDSHDLFEPYNTGTTQNPLYKFQPAELVDPLVAQTRALRRIIQSAAGDDYKYSAVEHWLQENMDMLDVHSKQEARHSPLATFMNNNLTRRWRNDLRGQAALSNRYKIQKLIGMPTYADSQINMVKQVLADMAFETDSKTKKAFLIPPSWALSKIHNPVDFMRGMAFHENLGLYNWMQLASQNTAYINIFAMSPTHAIPGVYGAWMHIWSRVNKGKAIVAMMDKNAEKFGWKPGWFTQAMQVYDSTGFNRIGNTLAIHDPDVKFLMSNANKVLQNGSKYFFELSEQNVRHGSFYAAFHEYKAAFPNKVINDLETGKILSRANDMYMNMGRDSKTSLNTGVLSMSLQFFKYIENTTQTFLSKRVGNVFGKENNRWTRAQQRAQMIAMYSLMFGPLGAAGLATLLPINDYVRKTAMQDNTIPGTSIHYGGYVPGQNKLSTLLIEGPASMAGAYASGWWRTGEGDMSKGTFYNYNNRYGNSGYQMLRDLLENSKNFWDIVLGASGSTISSNFKSLSPFVHAWVSAYNDEQDNPFKLTLNDWKEGLRNVSSFRNAERFTYAIAFGKWLDRHGRPQQDIGQIDTIFRTLLGVNDVNLDDLYLMRQNMENRKDNYKKASEEYMHYRTLMDEAIKNGDNDQATQYGRDASFILKRYDVPADEASKIFSGERNRSRNTQDKIYDDFYKKSVPVSQQPALNEAYRARTQSKE